MLGEKRALLACDGWNSEYAPKRGGLVSVSMAGHKGVMSIWVGGYASQINY